MSVSKQFWFLQRADSRLPQIIPLLAAGGMFCSSFLPWLRDPLGETYSAWTLPVDIGWQFRLGTFNYGLLCFCCTVYAGLVACANWRSFKGSNYFRHKYVQAGLLCFVPIVLFLLQYLCVDVRDIDLLAQHKIQALLIDDHFGYRAPGDLIPISPFYLDISTISGRIILLIDQLGVGILLPLISAWILLDYKRLFSVPPRASRPATKHKGVLFLIGGVLLVVLLRGPAGLVVEYEAKALLSSGQYAQALVWLDAASFLNPALDQEAYYHRERGEALYYLHPDQLTDDSAIYLAYIYRKQRDYLDAYQALLGVWRTEHDASWAASEMSITLEGLAEYTHPLRGPLIKRPLNDDTSLPWIQSLIQVDSASVYGHYVAGRIDCDLHDYTGCMTQMSIVIHLSSNPDIQSSAYTYIGLSEIGQGNEVQGRELLFKATELDPAYRNNVAREELSGLR